ncbi:uncharacterized protein LOC125845649 [Solanum stenotomum]|uniref:uncharacterized protein LOC125845649 n=1 Tax=Solanum stenotomum TaxID=172797 RepID=UPI0020D02790|nr:uncharacterized protein LOC125845649 [Solanum stenotomum]
MKKTHEEAIEILNELAENANQCVVENSERKKTVGVHQVDTFTTLQTHVASIAKDVKQLTLAQAQMTQSITCDFYAGRHPTHECQQGSFTEEKNNVRGQRQTLQGYQNHQRQQYQPHEGQHGNQSSFEEMFKSFITKVDEQFEIQGAFIRNLEKQVGQIANQISERPPINLPSDTLRNPKELKVVTLRSGKKLNDNCKSKACEVIKSQDEKQGSKKIVGKSNEIQKGKEKSELEIDSKYMSALPFPQNMKREKLNKYFGKFLEMLKQLHVNIPFTENKLPQKCGDPGSFTIPCTLGTARFEKLLCDSGASINLLPLFIFKKLEGELGIIKSIPMSLQLADQSTIIPEGIVEDVLVRVDKFVFPIDFIVVDIKENKEVSLILSQPFLATGRAILDVYERKLMLRVGEEKVVFNMKKVDDLTFKTTKSDKKIIAWVRVRLAKPAQGSQTLFMTSTKESQGSFLYFCIFFIPWGHVIA